MMADTLPNRHTIRWQGYDYSAERMYFVTIIMPNHIHGIIIINAPVTPVGADCLRPNFTDDLNNNVGECNSRLRPSIQTLGSIIGGYKSTVTRQINNSNIAPNPKIWERNYYEHIIRNEKSYNNIADYIANNPTNWQSDDYYIKQPA